MIAIDGAQQSGSGTIVRYAVALAALLGRPVRVFNARKHREVPGLRPSHVTSIAACAEICHGTTEGVTTGSTEFTFVPGARISGGAYTWLIGTAGSAPMLGLTVLPLACVADGPIRARIEGGVFQDNAPSPYHMQHVLAGLLQTMGVAVSLEVVRPGYIPVGAGVLQLEVTPAARHVRPLMMMDRGAIGDVRGIAVASHLAQRRVSDRMASVCEALLRSADLSCSIARVDDTTAQHAGAGLAIWAESTTGCRFGADCAGALGRSSEAIGTFVAQTFLEDWRSGATVDRHAADQLVLFAALAQGRSRYIVPRVTAHLAANVWLMGQFGARGAIDGRQVTIEGLGIVREEATQGVTA